jgi:ceramide glucosyltransferase
MSCLTAMALGFALPGWRFFLLVLAATPLAYYTVATIAALRFFTRARVRQRATYSPPVSLLKPVRGVDFGSYENFASFCTQEYSEYEILFGVGDDGDPAVPLIQRLISDFPQRRITLSVGAERIGANRKVNMLERLAREARHDILVLTDGDVRVSSTYLREVVMPLADSKIGAVTSFYRGIAQKNLGAELEAVGAASDFFAGVLVANWMEGMTFALGASIATTKSWVKKIGGFVAIADLLADDYELGHRIAKTGGKILLSRESVWTMYPVQTARGFWQHQVRWARTVRLCRPISFAGLIFTHGLPWAVVAALVAPASWIAVAYLIGYLVLRLTVAWIVGVWGVGDDVVRRKLWLVPLRDAIYFLVWLASFASNHIYWGAEEYIIRKGRLLPVTPRNTPNAGVTSQAQRAPSRSHPEI